MSLRMVVQISGLYGRKHDRNNKTCEDVPYQVNLGAIEIV